jgi:hypothetical protein
MVDGPEMDASLKCVYNKRFGEPVPMFVSTSRVVRDEIPDATLLGVAPGMRWRYRAATPETCGAAIEVPLCTEVAVLLVHHVDVMFCPGANRSTHDPKSENAALASAFVVAPTVIADATRPGEPWHASTV